ncbi:MAG: hypothetical protein OXI52_01015 [Caldilineaceae bacterium]|nr:hypothetical protein [Caldilineaceae bacterium]
MARTIAQIQFTQQQIEQLEDLRRQTGLTRTELVLSAVDFYILHIREHGYTPTTIPLPTVVTSEAR